MKIRLLAVFFLIAMPAASVHSNYQIKGTREALAKIAPWVLEQAGAKKQVEFLVVLMDQADLSAAETLTTKEEKGWYVFKTLYNKAQSTQKPILNWLRSNGIEHHSFYIVNMIWVKGTLDIALALAGLPAVARIDGNPVNRNGIPEEGTEADDSIQPATIESGINYSNAPQVWSLGFTGQGIVVGGADTGYRWDHTAVKTQYRGWNGSIANHNYNWHDSIHSGGGSCGPDSSTPCDDNGHGTHTIGTATGDDGGTNQIGMAPNAKWIGCRNMNQGFGTPATYTECFEFFLAPYPVGGTPAQGDPTKAPDVTTNSWGCPPSEGCSAVTLQSAVAAQRAAGIITVVAAGNSGSACSTVDDPASIFAESFTVGALSTGTDIIASFSSRGPVTVDGSNRQKPDISAPGTSTRSATRATTTSYGSMSGTSMATPHVAGAVALILSAQPSLRGQVSAVEGILKDSAVPISSVLCGSSGVPNNVFGYGRLNALAATNIALTTFAPKSATFTALGAGGSLQVSAPSGTTWAATTNESWIIINSGGGTGNGSVNFTVQNNPGEKLRVGKITIARREFIVRQEGVGAVGCGCAVTPKSQSFPSSGGSGSFTVVAEDDCIWIATSNDGWVTFTSDNGSVGTGTLTFTVSANGSSKARVGAINACGATFTVKQKGL